MPSPSVAGRPNSLAHLVNVDFGHLLGGKITEGKPITFRLKTCTCRTNDVRTRFLAESGPKRRRLSRSMGQGSTQRRTQGLQLVPSVYAPSHTLCVLSFWRIGIKFPAREADKYMFANQGPAEFFWTQDARRGLNVGQGHRSCSPFD